MSRIPLCLTKIPSREKILNSYGDRNLKSIEIARAAFGNDIQWSNGQTIKIGFFRDNFMYEGNNLNPNFSIEKAKWVEFGSSEDRPKDKDEVIDPEFTQFPFAPKQKAPPG